MALAACSVIEHKETGGPNDLRALAAHRAVAFIPSRNDPVCAIIRVIDGDTIEIRCPKGQGSARLLGFDTPEISQSGCDMEKQMGRSAREFLSKRLEQSEMIVPEVAGRDKYGRVLLNLWLDGESLDQIMVKNGYAVTYSGGKRINWCDKLRGKK